MIVTLITTLRLPCLSALMAAGFMLAMDGGPLLAQPRQAPVAPAPNAIGGSGPITIDADRLEVLDKDKRAVFTGNVVAARGDMTVRSSTMTVFYDADLTGNTSANKPAAANSNQSVRRIEMTGKVLFVQRDQQATGDAAVYERASETLILSGNVVLTQCQNVVTGPRLVVNLRTNQAQVEGAPGARVRSILVPGDQPSPPGTAATGAGCTQPAASPPQVAPPPPAPKRKN